MTPLYLGSVPDMSALSENVGTKKGFVGCVSQVVVSSRSLKISPSLHPYSSRGITECETCASQPCDNGGKCQVTLSVVLMLLPLLLQVILILLFLLLALLLLLLLPLLLMLLTWLL